MISEPTLARALEEGVISSPQLTRLREIEASLALPPEPQDEEKLRLITGFGDIFVTIGVALAPAILFGARAERPFATEVELGSYWLTRLKSKRPTAAMAAFEAWLVAEASVA